MASTCEWIGASGTRYTYYIYELPATLKDALGNYIFSKRNSENRWVPIYIGEGDLYDRVSIGGHLQSSCIARKGATHVHAHLADDKEDSQSEEADLLGRYTSAYQPSGCNESPGG